MPTKKSTKLDWQDKFVQLRALLGEPTADFPGGLMYGQIRVWWRGRTYKAGPLRGDLTGYGRTRGGAVNHAWQRAISADWIKHEGQYWKYIDNAWQRYYLSNAERDEELCDF